MLVIFSVAIVLQTSPQFVELPGFEEGSHEKDTQVHKTISACYVASECRRRPRRGAPARSPRQRAHATAPRGAFVSQSCCI